MYRPLLMMAIYFCYGAVLTQNIHAIDFRLLSAQELVAEGDRLNAVSGEISGEVANALANRAIELLLHEDLVQQETQTTLGQLVLLAKPKIKSLDEQQKLHLKNLLATSPQPTSSLEFEELRYRFILAETLQRPGDVALNLIEEWLSAKEIPNLSIAELQWCLQQCLPSNEERKEFSVVWTGLLTPPQTGDYTFSISPINVNSPDAKTVRHNIKVDIAGTRVIDALRRTSPAPQAKPADRTRRRSRELVTTKQWNWEGEAITLQASQPIPIKVEMAYRSEELSEAAAPSALLFWEGPTIQRQIISAKVLQGSEGQKSLQAEFRWKEGGQERLIAQPSESIDFAWSTPAIVAPRNLILVRQLTSRIFELATSDSYLKRCLAGQTTHLYFKDLASTEYLSSKQRQKFLEILFADRTELLHQASAEQLLRVYRRFRFGAEELALDTLGSWMQSRTDLTPKIATNFFRENRQAYWQLARYLSQHRGGHLQKLQELYLETDDGRCVLPVAYTIGYGHVVQGTFPEWIELLNSKLADDSLTSEQRINWLIARAQAAEINGQPIKYRRLGGESLLSGRDWLIESRLIAESEETQRRITREMFSRFAAHRMWEEAEEELQTNLLPAEVAAGQSQLKQLKAEAESLILAEKRRSGLAKIAIFQRRHDKAEKRGDEASVSRYVAKIEQLEAITAQLVE